MAIDRLDYFCFRRRRWEERRTNATDLHGAERPYYNLMMYPYPSAEGLHVGNVFAFVGADVYGRVRAAAFMGYRILAVARGCRAEVTGNLARIEDSEWHGYLANCEPKEFEQRWSKELPDDMSGVEFLARYGAGWRGPRIAWFTIIGFLLAVFSMLAVNRLFTTFHDFRL